MRRRLLLVALATVAGLVGALTPALPATAATTPRVMLAARAVLHGAAAQVPFAWPDAAGVPTLFVDGFDVAESGTGSVRSTGPDRWVATLNTTEYDDVLTVLEVGRTRPDRTTALEVWIVNAATGGFPRVLTVEGSPDLRRFEVLAYPQLVVEVVQVALLGPLRGGTRSREVDTTAPYAATVDLAGLPEDAVVELAAEITDSRGLVTRVTTTTQVDRIPAMTIIKPDRPQIVSPKILVVATGGQDSSVPPRYLEQPVLYVDGARVDQVPHRLYPDRDHWEWVVDVGAKRTGPLTVAVGDDRGPLRSITVPYATVPQPQRLRLSVPKTVLRHGEVITVSARAKKGSQVVLMGLLPDGKRTRLRVGTANAEGLVSFRVAPTRNLALYVGHSPTPGPLDSAAVALRVGGAVRAFAYQRGPGEPVFFAGTISPCVPGQVLPVHRLVPGGSRVLAGYIQVGKCRRTGQPTAGDFPFDFAAGRTFSGRGTFTFVVTLPRDRWSLGAVSGPVTITIR